MAKGIDDNLGEEVFDRIEGKTGVKLDGNKGNANQEREKIMKKIWKVMVAMVVLASMLGFSMNVASADSESRLQVQFSQALEAEDGGEDRLPVFDMFIGEGVFVFNASYGFEVPSSCGLAFYQLDESVSGNPEWKYLAAGENALPWRTYRCISMGCTSGFTIEGTLPMRQTGWGMWSSSREAVNLFSAEEMPVLPNQCAYWIGQVHHSNHVTLRSIMESVEGGGTYRLVKIYLPGPRGLVGKPVSRKQISNAVEVANQFLEHAKPFVLVLKELK